MPLLLPCLADVGRARTELQKAFELGVLIAVGGVDVDVQPGFPFSGSSLRLRMIVGCGPPNPSRGPISTEPSSSRSSTTKSRTWHQNRATTSGSRQPSTSSLIRHAITKPALSLGTAGETTREPHGLPAVKTIPRPYRRGEHGRNDFRAAPVRAAGQVRWPCSREADFETRPSGSFPAVWIVSGPGEVGAG